MNAASPQRRGRTQCEWEGKASIGRMRDKVDIDGGAARPE